MSYSDDSKREGVTESQNRRPDPDLLFLSVHEKPSQAFRKVNAMIYRFLFLSSFVLCTISTVTGQSNQQRESSRYIVVPSEHMLLVVASQPSAPARFEDVKLLMNVSRQELTIGYKVRNVGKKPIRYVTPIMWTSFGTGGTISGDSGVLSGRINDELVMPGGTVEEKPSDEIIPLTEELGTKLGLRGPMKAIVAVMIGRVTFSDGTTYTDEATSKALLNYFENLSDDLERLRKVDKKPRVDRPRHQQ